MKVAKILPFIACAIMMVCCNKPAGELVGATKSTNFKEANPYGMLFIKKGSFMMGANTQTVVSVEDVMAAATWLAPLTQAFFTGIPCLCSRNIFSITTMELSTSIPIPSASPDMEMIFRVLPVANR